jgi:hypothetical protein
MKIVNIEEIKIMTLICFNKMCCEIFNEQYYNTKELSACKWEFELLKNLKFKNCKFNNYT